MKDIRQNWKTISSAKTITSTDVVALCIYRTLQQEESVAEALQRLKKSFTPITNSIKLANGATPHFSLRTTLAGFWYLKYNNSSLTRWLPEENYEAVRAMALELLKEVR